MLHIMRKRTTPDRKTNYALCSCCLLVLCLCFWDFSPEWRQWTGRVCTTDTWVELTHWWKYRSSYKWIYIVRPTFFLHLSSLISGLLLVVKHVTQKANVVFIDAKQWLRLNSACCGKFSELNTTFPWLQIILSRNVDNDRMRKFLLYFVLEKLEPLSAEYSARLTDNQKNKTNHSPECVCALWHLIISIGRIHTLGCQLDSLVCQHQHIFDMVRWVFTIETFQRQQCLSSHFNCLGIKLDSDAVIS